MDMSRFSSSESDHLKAADYLGKNLKAVIKEVGSISFDAAEGRPAQERGTLSFEGKEKILVLNATNNGILCDAYGPDSDDWIGHEIGLSTKEYKQEGFAPGWVVEILDVEKEFSDDIPF